MRRLLMYLDPIAHLGEKEYSILFPLVSNITLCVLSELFAYGIAKDPMIVGVYIIFLNVFFIIYFSFRDGIRGGFISTIISTLYYFYIIYTRHYKGQQLQSGIQTTIILAVLYFLIGFIIGWLKQTIDQLIERQANEKIRLQTILQQLPVGVIITDDKGMVIQANKQLEKITGVRVPIGFIVGKDKQLTYGRQNDIPVGPTDSPIYQTLQTGKPIVGKEFEILKKDNKKTYVRINSSIIHDKNRKVIAAASIISDITSQKELERQKDDFLSMASHELKTPITSLKMFVDLQGRELKEKYPEKAKYFNRRINDQVNRLKELTGDLLDVSRVQTGKLHFSFEEFDLSAVIHDAVEGLQSTTHSHKILFGEKKKYIVKADRYRIYQVLVNLITNAIKYSSKNKDILIKVRGSRKQVVVSVKDFGIGIEKDQLNKIFDKLYQVSAPEEKTFPGLGLGLYISKEIILRHDGKIWAESTKGKGSTFYFSLPIKSQIK